MKKALLLTFVLFLLAGCSPGMQRYYNKEHRFSLLFPRSWQREEFPAGSPLVLLARQSKVMPEDKYYTSLNVVVRTLTHFISPDAFFELNRAKLMEVLPGTEYNVLEDRLRTRAGLGRYLIFSTQIKEDLAVRSILCIWMKENRVYVITCTSEENKFPQYQPIFKKILRSFHLK